MPRSTASTNGEPIQQGERNTRLATLAGSLRRQGASEAEILRTLQTANESRCTPALPREEIEQIAQSRSRYPSASQQIRKTIPLTDTGNAERFAAQHVANVRYCHPWGKWLVWDETRWKLDDTGAVDRLAKATVRSIYEEASTCLDDALRKALVSHARSSESAARRAATLKLAQSEAGVPVLPERLDKDLWLLNCRNGTIDLRTGKLWPHCRDDFITKLAPVEYDRNARCPLWITFLKRILNGNRKLGIYLQRLLGYGLTGSTREHVLPFLYGTGANGKSTFINTVLALLGSDYAIKAPGDLLLLKRNESHPTERADLHGKRFCACVEAEEGRRLAESLVKEMTGGDRIRAR